MKSNRTGPRIGVTLSLFFTLGLTSSAEDPTRWSFATELASSGDAENAAIEFRRIALTDDDAASCGAAYWYSAYQYWRLKQPELSDKMLDRSEDSGSDLAQPIALLRGENARLTRSWDEAAFHFQSVLNRKPSPEMRAYAARSLAAADMQRGHMAEARDVIRAEMPHPDDSLAALDTYERGKDRDPVLGGMLGLIPGLGYAYSGEYANAFRSILLNALFGFGMYHTGSRDQWGAFAGITFFEITWYSGSIYGGVDAAHRYNLNRQEACEDAIRGTASFEPDWIQIPLIKLKYTF